MLLADLVVVLHLLWIVFLIFGAVPGHYRRWARNIHLAALAYSLALEIFGWTCPLTHLENWLRRIYQPESAYGGGFMAHYAQQLVYPDLPPALILAGSLLIVAVSLWVYFGPLRRRR